MSTLMSETHYLPQDKLDAFLASFQEPKSAYEGISDLMHRLFVIYQASCELYRQAREDETPIVPTLHHWRLSMHLEDLPPDAVYQLYGSYVQHYDPESRIAYAICQRYDDIDFHFFVDLQQFGAVLDAWSSPAAEVAIPVRWRNALVSHFCSAPVAEQLPALAL